VSRGLQKAIPPEGEKIMTNEIRIYVADLAAYNAGYLHGVWIDATQELDDIQAEVSAMLKASPVADAEEYAIHDHEGFGDYSLGEYAGLETAHDVALFIEEFPEFGAALLGHFGDLDDAKKAAQDSYCGSHSSLADYAQELTEETTEIPESLRHYIDYESMAHDMTLNGDVFAFETGYQQVHIFCNH
jgi:antirestriction protein